MGTRTNWIGMLGLVQMVGVVGMLASATAVSSAASLTTDRTVGPDSTLEAPTSIVNPPLPNLPDLSISPPNSTIVEIDGRFVTVEVSVTRVFPGNPVSFLLPTQGPTTQVSVKLSVEDGALLPDGLTAVGVRFEKLRGIKRFFFTPIKEVPTAVPFDVSVEDDVLVPELDEQSYFGDLSDKSAVKFLRAVVRLELADPDTGQIAIIKPELGVVPVQLVLLP